jgi:DNA-binding MarR family transcriptional regulator
VPSELAPIALAVKRLQVRHHRAIDGALQDIGASLAQWDALRHLHEHPDASLHDIAVLTFQSDQAMGTLAQRMIDRGLITRVAGRGRAVRHALTDRGEAVRTRAQDLVDQALATSFSPLDPAEVAVLGRLLAKLVPDGSGDGSRPSSGAVGPSPDRARAGDPRAAAPPVPR